MISKKDITYIFLITAIITIVFVYTFGFAASIYSDIGREFYIPWRMNSGDILYKDIFNVYAPLGYQINALLLKIFGSKMSTLYIAGFISSLIAVNSIFFITKEFTGKIYAFLVSLFVIFICTFNQSISNWITPYSYSVLYAMTSFLLSLFMLILYIKDNKFKYFTLSCFFTGVSIASKYEYSLFILILIFCAFYKKFGIKQIIFSFLSFIFAPVLSAIVLLIQGVHLNDFICALNYIKELSSSETLKYFYTYTGFIPTAQSLTKYIFFDKSLLFSSFGIISILIAIFSFKTKDIKYIILCLSCVLASTKSICYLPLNLYGTFFLPAIFLMISVFIYRYKNKKIIFIPYITFVLISVFLYACFDLQTFEQSKSNRIEFNGNRIYTDNKYFSDRYNEIIKYIEVNTNENDTILVLPEGVILNFLTKRKSDNKYYYLIPPNVEIFKQEQIISDLQKAPPKIIIIFSNKYYWYNTGSFENTYGEKVYNYIKDAYDFDYKNSGIYDKIYKLKDK